MFSMFIIVVLGLQLVYINCHEHATTQELEVNERPEKLLDQTRRFAAKLRGLPHLILTPLDETLAQQAADVAAQYRLRGSDAVYAAVALRFGSTLVTLDREQRHRAAAVIPVRLPTEALAEWA